MKKSKSIVRPYKFIINSNFYLIVAFLMLCFILIPNTMYAQASLAAENKIEDITVTTKYGKQVTYTLIRDAQVPEQWYYMPRGIRVAEDIDVVGKVKPKMTILKYQYQDKISKGTKEGAVLSATFTMAMESEVVEEVKKKLLEKVRNLKNQGSMLNIVGNQI